MLTGSFSQSVSFGRASRTTVGFDDIFLAKIGPFSNEPVVTAIADVGNDQGRLDLGWTFVGEMPAHGQPSYAMDVATIGDSTVSQG